MAYLGAGLMALTGATDPMAVLAFVAPAWVFVNAGLLLGVTARLGLSFPLQAVAMACYAASTLTRLLHRAGMLDHHFVEYTFVLALLYFGLGWFRNLASARRATLLAAALGMAPAFHNGLFVLQVPVLLTFATLWWLRRELPVRAAAAFAAALLGVTALFLLPSQPFRAGMFEFYLHSWFHLYVAACTGAACLFMSLRPRSLRAAVVLAGAAALFLVPILARLVHGAEFVLANIMEYDTIEETRSIAAYVESGQAWRMNWTYSYLLWALPFGLAYLCWRLRFDASAVAIFFTVASVFGAALLVQQIRFLYFGSFALYLPWCVLAEDMRRHSARFRDVVPLALAIAMAAAYVPSVSILRAGSPPATDHLYGLLRPFFPALKAACAARPGVVLAAYNEGHYLRYHTDCSVIADPFILTPQHQRKVRLARELLASSLNDALARAPYVRYILVRRADPFLATGAAHCFPDCPENAGLRQELLAQAPPYPARLRLLVQSEFRGANGVEPYARLFEVLR
jgi:hypothetical protein